MALFRPRGQLLLLSYLLYLKQICHHIMMVVREMSQYVFSNNVPHTPVILMYKITIVSGHMIICYIMSLCIMLVCISFYVNKTLATIFGCPHLVATCNLGVFWMIRRWQVWILCVHKGGRKKKNQIESCGVLQCGHIYIYIYTSGG